MVPARAACLDDAVDIRVAEGEHAAVRVVQQQDLLGAEQLLRDDQAAEGVLGSAPSGVANHMSVSNRESQGRLRVYP